MNKVTLVSSFLAAATLGVVARVIGGPTPGFKFLSGSHLISSVDTKTRFHQHVRLDRFNLHVPFDEAWGAAQSELCASKQGWKLGSGSSDWQNFVFKNHETISMIRGKVDDQLNFLDGTEQTDTFVVVQREE